MLCDFIQMLRGDWIEKVSALLISAVVSAIIGFGCWATYVAADSWFVEDADGIAEVCGRSHGEPWVQTLVHSDGKGGCWTQTIYHPESWQVALRIGGESDSVIVSEYTFNAVCTGQQVPVRYRRGRFSSGLYITEAQFR